MGFLQASVEFALQREELEDKFEEVYIIELTVFGDNHDYFMEIYHREGKRTTTKYIFNEINPLLELD